MNTEVFEDLFVLEMANNHWGDVERGLKIITDFARVVRYNGVRATIKLQLRDVERFIHEDFRDRQDIRYVKKTLDTQLSRTDIAKLFDAIRKNGCMTSATPFDEASVDLCVDLGVQLIKIASSDLNDWLLIEKIAETHKPVIVSTGGSSLKDIDDLVRFFDNRNIPLAINHCVSLYPSEDSELEINQIDFLRDRYPGHVIGFSTHEYHDWEYSILIAYAKGARTFERHIDIPDQEKPVSAYCSTPEQIDTWFRAHKRAVTMCGGSGVAKRVPSSREVIYLDGLVRGVYAKRDLPAGHVIQHNKINDDIYLAVPLQKGQLSCREIMSGEMLLRECKANEPLLIDMLDGPHVYNPNLRKMIEQRGI
jgi:N-acetylneuraminate synthase